MVSFWRARKHGSANLWARLIELVRVSTKGGTNWILPFELFGSIERAELASDDEVHLFGFSYVWHGLPELIKLLIQKSDVLIYSLAPFIELGKT